MQPEGHARNDIGVVGPMLSHILHHRGEVAMPPFPLLFRRAQAHLSKTVVQRKRERQPPIAREVPRCIRTLIEEHGDL
jgi:hypothetical protein